MLLIYHRSFFPRTLCLYLFFPCFCHFDRESSSCFRFHSLSIILRIVVDPRSLVHDHYRMHIQLSLFPFFAAILDLTSWDGIVEHLRLIQNCFDVWCRVSLHNSILIHANNLGSFITVLGIEHSRELFFMVIHYHLAHSNISFFCFDMRSYSSCVIDV